MSAWHGFLEDDEVCCSGGGAAPKRVVPGGCAEMGTFEQGLEESEAPGSCRLEVDCSKGAEGRAGAPLPVGGHITLPATPGTQ